MAHEVDNTIGDDLSAVLDRLKGHVASDDEIAEWESGQASQLRGELLRSSGVSEVLSTRAFTALTADRVGSTRALDLVRAWSVGWTPMLGLFGPTDAGKTFAAAWALSGTPGRYIESNALARERRGHFGGPTADYERAVRTGLLVIDELGREDDAVHAATAIDDVLNRRLRGSRRTLLIGNIDRATFIARYGERAWSRLKGVGMVVGLAPVGFRDRGEG